MIPAVSRTAAETGSSSGQLSVNSSGRSQGSCLFDHTVSVEKDTSSHLAIAFIFSLEDRFPRCSSVFLEELARRP